MKYPAPMMLMRNQIKGPANIDHLLVKIDLVELLSCETVKADGLKIIDYGFGNYENF
jgi:hypothetical protein